jgi:hypothetical protein
MTTEIKLTSPVKSITRRTPGHLLASFGWAADAIAAMDEAKPTLLTYVFELDRARMHLIALAFAHLNEVSPDIGSFLFSGSVRAITEQILGRYPTGIRRALGHLPPSVLTPENYRHLVELLADRKTAKLLHHAPSIDGSTIEALHGLPAPLRNPVILGALECADQVNGFSEGLHFLVSRGAASSFDALVGELALVSQSVQLYAKLRTIVVELPLLPNTLPPTQVGGARRLDKAVTIRSLAKSWHNCLAEYLGDINSGTCAVYLWEHSDGPAACSVRRYGRLGWFLEQVKGPQNADIEPMLLDHIRSTFSEIGLPPYSVISTIHCMIVNANMNEAGLRRIERERRAIERFLPHPEDLDMAEL